MMMIIVPTMKHEKHIFNKMMGKISNKTTNYKFQKKGQIQVDNLSSTDLHLSTDLYVDYTKYNEVSGETSSYPVHGITVSKHESK